MISQREARRLQKRVAELEEVLRDQRYRWTDNWPGGTNFWTITGIDNTTMAAIRTARALQHAVVVVPDDSNAVLRFYALEPWSEKELSK